MICITGKNGIGSLFSVYIQHILQFSSQINYKKKNSNKLSPYFYCYFNNYTLPKSFYSRTPSPSHTYKTFSVHLEHPEQRLLFPFFLQFFYLLLPEYLFAIEQQKFEAINLYWYCGSPQLQENSKKFGISKVGIYTTHCCTATPRCS